MSWFDDQIRQRKVSDDEAFARSFSDLGDMLMGRHYREAFANDRVKTKSAMDEIIRFYHGELTELPESVKDENEAMEYLCRPNGIMRRRVNLTRGWYKEASGAYLAFRKDGSGPAALLPSPGGLYYTYPDPVSGKRVRLTAGTAELFEEEAVCFYQSLPLRKLTAKDLFLFGIKSWSKGNAVLILAFTFILSLLGLLLPRFNYLLASEVM